MTDAQYGDFEPVSVRMAVQHDNDGDIHQISIQVTGGTTEQAEKLREDMQSVLRQFIETNTGITASEVSEQSDDDDAWPPPGWTELHLPSN